MIMRLYFRVRQLWNNLRFHGGMELETKYVNDFAEWMKY